jgi:hypothetical protein
MNSSESSLAEQAQDSLRRSIDEAKRLTSDVQELLDRRREREPEEGEPEPRPDNILLAPNPRD